MNNVINATTNRMDVRTFNAIQTVKYGMRAAKKTSLEMYRRPDILHSPVDKSICHYMQTAYSRSQNKKKHLPPPKKTSCTVQARAMHIKKTCSQKKEENASCSKTPKDKSNSNISP